MYIRLSTIIRRLSHKLFRELLPFVKLYSGNIVSRNVLILGIPSPFVIVLTLWSLLLGPGAVPTDTTLSNSSCSHYTTTSPRCHHATAYTTIVIISSPLPPPQSYHQHHHHPQPITADITTHAISTTHPSPRPQHHPSSPPRHLHTPSSPQQRPIGAFGSVVKGAFGLTNDHQAPKGAFGSGITRMGCILVGTEAHKVGVQKWNKDAFGVAEKVIRERLADVDSHGVTSTFRHPEVSNTSIKLLLFPFSLEGEARTWLDKEPPRSILTWDDLETLQRRHGNVSKAKPLPLPSSSSVLIMVSRFTSTRYVYNSLNSIDQDRFRFRSQVNFLDKVACDGLAFIESKSKVRYSKKCALQLNKSENKEKLEEITITTVNAECSAIIMNKVPENSKIRENFLSQMEEDVEIKNSNVSNEPVLLNTPLSDKVKYFALEDDIDEIDAFLAMEVSSNFKECYFDSEGDVTFLDKSESSDDTTHNLASRSAFSDHEQNKNSIPKSQENVMLSKFSLSGLFPYLPIPLRIGSTLKLGSDIFLVPDDLIPPGVENDDSEDEDNELPNLDHQDDPSIPRPPPEPPDVEKCFEPEAGILITKVFKGVSKSHDFMANILPTLPTLVSDLTFILFLSSFLSFGSEDTIFDPGIFT
ncbi:hypothetical protein Tco_0706654 [Tanacetum coccineum]|uniref:Uncharacterized protein n=1 Tax=Tanacetum coccineum TaxID=301880 RepID=A0ABQ4Y7Z7_9ASTR